MVTSSWWSSPNGVGHGQRDPVTRIVAVPTTLFVLPAMMTEPGACAVTSPALLTEAIASFDDDQVNTRLGTVAPLEL